MVFFHPLQDSFSPFGPVMSRGERVAGYFSSQVRTHTQMTNTSHNMIHQGAQPAHLLPEAPFSSSSSIPACSISVPMDFSSSSILDPISSTGARKRRKKKRNTKGNENSTHDKPTVMAAWGEGEGAYCGSEFAWTFPRTFLATKSRTIRVSILRGTQVPAINYNRTSKI